MRRLFTCILPLALVIAACGAASPTATSTPASPSPATSTPVGLLWVPDKGAEASARHRIATVLGSGSLAASPTAETAAPVDVTVKFDGTTCSYIGPTVVPDGASLRFHVLLTKYILKPGQVMPWIPVGPVEDGTTLEMIKAHTKPVQPDWQISAQALVSSGSWDQTSSMVVTLTGHDYSVFCFDNYGSYGAALIKVVPA